MSDELQIDLVRQALVAPKLSATGACRTKAWCDKCLSHQVLCDRQPVAKFTHDSQFTETLEQVQKITHTTIWLMIQEWKAAFGLTKGEKESCFWFLKKEVNKARTFQNKPTLFKPINPNPHRAKASSLQAPMADRSPTSSEFQAPLSHITNPISGNQFFVWREFLWGGIAGGFGEGMMHPVDTVKTRIQSQAILSGSQNQKSISQMVRSVWAADGLRGFYRGVTPGVTGSLATGATYFGFIESTKKWIEESHPSLGGHWAHFIAGAVGDTLGSFVYVPCEVMKQRMQVQGTIKSWGSILMKDNICVKSNLQMYGYYTGIYQAGSSIWREQGLRGLYAGYWSTLARDVPFAGLMVMFYEALKDLTEYGKQRWIPSLNSYVNISIEGLVLGGLAGGFSAYLTTPLDVIKTRMQVQGSTARYNGWSDAVRKIWMTEGMTGMFRGSIPRITWYIPASALTFMAVEFLRDHFNEKLENDDNTQEIASLSIEKKGSIREVA
ncbi:mitochondrial substrate carrier family protein [Citrus sinensis]|uniref:Mitochondrial substrate carrier family protein n=2 Tax=Citrus sinensis TaxID=2711 RepID=A0ACB8LXQ2_CITSI|nr:mitochondrial substrate carrier family protein [Citrus sinensis]